LDRGAKTDYSRAMIYAIGDIHGHADKLREAHRRIEEDWHKIGGTGRPTVVHIGDICDRGPGTKDAIQFLIDGIAAGADWIVLKGNHDRMFSNFLATGETRAEALGGGLTWTSPRVGGEATLASYARRRLLENEDKYLRRVRAAVPKAHAAFLVNLPIWYRAQSMIFVHAGIRPGFPLEAQDEEDLLWIRDDFLWHLGEHEALIVHGHTPVDEPTHYGNRINIDTGAGWGNHLVPVVFEPGRFYALTENGRNPLTVPKIRVAKASQT
jgi:serine/threonine protein phosphatase 1